jgi:hypothetical protein
LFSNIKAHNNKAHYLTELLVFLWKINMCLNSVASARQKKKNTCVSANAIINPDFLAIFGQALSRKGATCKMKQGDLNFAFELTDIGRKFHPLRLVW